MTSLLDLSDGQQEGVLRAIEVVRSRIAPLAERIEESAEFPDKEIRELGRHGLLAVPIPAQYGGAGLDMVTCLRILEELAKVSGAIAATLGAHTILTMRPILRFGSQEQKDRYLGRLARGEALGAFALTEAHGGSDIGGIETTAVRSGDGYIMNGSKALIANANHADVFVVAAKTAPDRGALGISVFLLEKGVAGLRPSGRRERTLGMRGTDIGGLIIEDVTVPATSLLGRENFGMKVLHETLVEDRMATAAIALGIAASALAHSASYSNDRKHGGKPISSFQGIKNQLADMEVGVCAARLLVREAATVRDAGGDATRIASVAKLFASEAAMRAAKDAIQIFGGWGTMRDYPVERLLRDAKHTEIVDGTSEIQRLLIAAEVLRRRPR